MSTSSTVENSYSTTTANTDEEDISIPPSSAVLYNYLVYQVTGTLPFTADVVVDGDIVPNASGVSLASQLLPDEQTRTMTFAGNLVLQTMSTGEVHTKDTNGCAGNAHIDMFKSMGVKSAQPTGEAILQTEQCGTDQHKIGFGVFTFSAGKEGNLNATKFLRCLP